MMTHPTRQAGEQRKEQQTMEDSLTHENRTLEEVYAQLLQIDDPDSYLLYLIGVIEHRRGLRTQAIDTCIQAITLDEYNWAAWSELASCIRNKKDEELVRPQLKSVMNSIMFSVFLVHLGITVNDYKDQLYMDRIQSIKQIFPRSCFVAQAEAQAYYEGRDHATAMTLYEEILHYWPNCIEAMVPYSNVLYTANGNDATLKLHALALSIIEINPHSAEANMVIGNYYSRNGDREKALDHCKRAVKLDRNCHFAWIILGQERIEAGDTASAIEHYRRAADIKQRDHRAWYSLGQAYELLGLHSYSLYYYHEAVALRPRDDRLWMTLSQVYAHLKQFDDAIVTTKHALLSMKCKDTNGKMVLSLATFHRMRDNDQLSSTSIMYYRYFIDIQRKHTMKPKLSPQVNDPEPYIDVCQLLARYYKSKHPEMSARYQQYASIQEESVGNIRRNILLQDS